MREIPLLDIARAVTRAEVEVAREASEPPAQEREIGAPGGPLEPGIPEEEGREPEREKRLGRVDQIVEDGASLRRKGEGRGASRRPGPESPRDVSTAR